MSNGAINIRFSFIVLFLFSLIYGPIGIAGMTTGYFIIDSVFLILNYIFPSVSNLSFLSPMQQNLSPMLQNLSPIQQFLFIISCPLIVYFSCYFNYKLFYTFNFKNKQASLRLKNVKRLIKFVLVSIIASAFNVYLIELYFFKSLKSSASDYIYSFFTLMLLNFIFTLLLMSFISLYDLKVYEPKKSKHFLNHSKTFNILISISVIALIIQIIRIILNNDINNAEYNNISILFFNIVIIMLLVIFKPITKDVKVKKVNNSFNDFIVFIFMIIYSFSWAMAILWHVSITSNDFNTLKKNFYAFIKYPTIIELIITLGIIFWIIYYIQNNFSKPLHLIYKITRDYDAIKSINMNNENDEDNKNNNGKDIEYIVNSLKDLSSSKFEAGQLADSLKNMVEDNELYTDNLKKVTIEKEKMVSELDLGFKIQSSSIPNIFPPFPDRLNDFDIYASFNPARNVGGDFYDYFFIDDDHLAILIGDVSGKGVSSALFMMITKSLINYLIHSGLSPSEAFYQLNNRLLENNDKELFVTVWLGILEISSGKLTYVNAGHNLPYLFSKSNNQYAILEAKPNFVLGGMDNIKYIQHEIKIMEGDRLYLYTDGITESINQNFEEFSNERLLNLLNNKNHYNIKHLILEISIAVHNFSKNMEQFDDETMVLLEYRKQNI